jgi:membrane protein YqaA with SNARE-associated domain
MEAIGYVSLFVTAFAAATILPLSSEAVLSALVVSEGFHLWLLIATAGIGNTLGACVNWGLGRYCVRWRDNRWFPISSATLERHACWFHRYGVYTLLFSWVPIIGDPLTAIAGILKVRFVWFLPLVATGKTARYIVVVFMVERAFI